MRGWSALQRRKLASNAIRSYTAGAFPCLHQRQAHVPIPTNGHIAHPYWFNGPQIRTSAAPTLPPSSGIRQYLLCLAFVFHARSRWHGCAAWRRMPAQCPGLSSAPLPRAGMNWMKRHTRRLHARTTAPPPHARSSLRTEPQPTLHRHTRAVVRGVCSRVWLGQAWLAAPRCLRRTD